MPYHGIHLTKYDNLQSKLTPSQNQLLYNDSRKLVKNVCEYDQERPQSHRETWMDIQTKNLNGGNNKISHTFYVVGYRIMKLHYLSNKFWKVNKRAHGPLIAHLNSCQEKRMFTTKYKSHSPTLKSILGLTQIITKAYQVTKFNQIILICTISMSDLFTQPKKARGVHNVKHFNCKMWCAP